MKKYGKHEFIKKRPEILNENRIVMAVAIMCALLILIIVVAQCVDAISEPDPLPIPENDDPMAVFEGRMCVELLPTEKYMTYATPQPKVDIPEPTPDPTPALKPSELYPEDCLMAIANMVYNEIGGIVYDVNLSEYEKDLALQRWAKVALNHIEAGIAPDAVTLMYTKSGKYYIWAPEFATTAYRDRALKSDPDRYNRCVENVKRAIDGEMYEDMPSNVIYAAGFTQGSGVYKTYRIDTGYFRSTVYLCYR